MKNLFSFSRRILVVLILFVVAAVSAFAQTADVRYAGVFYSRTGSNDTVNAMYCHWSTNWLQVSKGATSPNNVSFVTSPAPTGNSNQTDPWVSSALIEYDQPYPSARHGSNYYPNHCLALCMNVKCDNKPLGGSTYSISFPLQNIRFDIVKYYNNKNVENPEETPAIRTIDLYPNTESTRCGSYRCPGKATDGWTCNGAQYYCTGYNSSGIAAGNCNGTCRYFSDGQPTTPGHEPCVMVDNYCSNYQNQCSCSDGVCNFVAWNYDGTTSNGNAGIPFCAAWDGSYEINGEFGKTNGQFAFRAQVSTDSPGDGVMVDKIQFDSMIAYPGMNQIPIQVDVTNVHMVRSTPSVVGTITPVAAQPYTYSYRLSKDADMRIAILDASSANAAAYANLSNSLDNDPIGFATGLECQTWDETKTTPEECYAEQPWGSSGLSYTWGTFLNGSTTKTGCCQTVARLATDENTAQNLVVRTLTDWEPRLGEGMRGREGEVQITEFDSWDGRNDQGMFLPAGNYVVT
ncbi:MAG: hypothetical protein J6V32_00050, partial [Elusimicrobiaceae bacterium]|nr:hypothetical protein [Elusimicrobiaceae bacterium]